MTGKTSRLLLTAFMIAIFISCKEDRETPDFQESYLEEVAENKEVIATLHAQSELSDFSEALNNTVETAIQSETYTYTVFAPTNDAFSLEEIDVDDPDILSEILKYHIVGETILLDDLRNKLQNTDAPFNLVALNGKEFRVTLEGDRIALTDELGNTAYILRSIDAVNGIVHIIDNTLIPEASLEN